MLTHCEKCGVRLAYWADYSGGVKFFGGVHAKLCNPCTSEIERALLASDIWRRVEQGCAEEVYWKAVAGENPVAMEKLSAIAEAERLLTIEAHDFVKALLPKEPLPAPKSGWANVMDAETVAREIHRADPPDSP